jgi:hypothetical protein
MANWSIYKAKEALTISRKFGIKAIFLMVEADRQLVEEKRTNSMLH